MSLQLDQAAHAAPKQTAQATPVNQQQPSAAVGVGTLRSTMNFGFTRGRAATSVTVVGSAVKRFLDQQALGFDCGITVVDNNVSATPLSAVVLSAKDARTCHYSILMVEGSEVTTINPIKIPQNHGPDLVLDRPASNLYDKDFIALIDEQLSRDESMREITSYKCASCIVIPSEMTAGATEETLATSEKIGQVAWYAINALVNAFTDGTDDVSRQFNVGWLAENNAAKVTARIELNETPMLDAVGLPVRADAIITLEAQAKDGNTNAKYSHSAGLTKTGVYMDLGYVEPEAAQQWFAKQGQTVTLDQVTQRYQPRIIISRVESELQLTDEVYMLGIAAAAAPLRGNMWVGFFEPRYGRVGDLHDVGAIGYEATHLTENNQGAMIDTRSDNFRKDRDNLPSFINAAMIMSPAFLLHVVEASDMGAVQSVYLAAAAGVPGAQAALQRTADKLTNGEFTKKWNEAGFGNAPYVTYTNTLIPLGYYEESDRGARRDVRDYDYLAYLNIHGPKDGATVEDYSETIDATQQDAHVRLYRLIDLQRKTIGSSATFKDFAHQLVLSSHFMQTLLAAFAANGFTVESNSIGSYEVIQSNRGNSSILGYGWTGQQGAFVGRGNNYNVGGGVRPQIVTPVY